MPALTYTIEFDDDLSGLYEGDPDEVVTATVYNDAANERGFEYFEAVDSGRGEVYPIDAKCLHWVEGGEDIFRAYSGPSVPRNLRQQALDNATARLYLTVQGNPVSNREELAELATLCANILMEEVEAVTPVRETGKLRQGYYVEEAT